MLEGIPGQLWFVSFADSRMRYAAQRIERQAREFGIFDHVEVLNEHDLDPEFLKQFGKYMFAGGKGFGCYCWKPQVPLQMLGKMKDGDILFYCDAGCHLNPGGLERFKSYIKRIANDKLGFVGFNSVEPDLAKRHSIGKYCKGDLLRYFGVENNQEILNSEQIGGTYFLVRKNPEAIAFIKKWKEPFEKDFTLIDNTPSRMPSAEEFVKHRHDQSILSILGRLRGIDTIIYPDEGVNPHNEDGSDDWENYPDYPMWVKRDRWGFQPSWVRRKLARILSSLMPSRKYRKIVRRWLMYNFLVKSGHF